MADWDTTTCDFVRGVNGHSRRSSHSSGSYKENRSLERRESNSTLDNSSQKELILRGGKELAEESRTEHTASVIYENYGLDTNFGGIPEIPSKQPIIHGSGAGTAKARAAKSPYASTESIPEVEITIPNNANISAYSCDELANFLKCLKIEDRIISHLHRKSVDGKRFAKIKDIELENLGIKNPVILFFRDKSNVKVKGKGPYML